MAGIELSSSSLNGDANLQGYWKLESDGTDSSGNGNTLTASGSPSHVSAKFGNGVDLEASSSQYYYKSTGFAFTGHRTFSAWVKPESIGEYCIIGKSNSGASVLVRLSLRNSDQKFQFQISNLTSGNEVAVSTTSAVAGKWFHVAGVYDGSNVKVYVNGVMENEVAGSGTSTDPGGKFGVGILGDYTGFQYFDGVIDDVAVFDRALTDAEINELYYDSPQNGNWTSSLEIQSDNTKVSGSSNLTNFPALISDSNLTSAVYAGLNNSDYSVTFNGSSQYSANSNAILNPLSDYTIEGWFKLGAEIGSGTWELFHLENNTAKHVIYCKYEYNSGTRRLNFQQDKWVVIGYNALHTVTLGTGWHHIAFRMTSRVMQIFLDGVAVGSTGTFTVGDYTAGTTATNNQVLAGAGTTVGTTTIVNYANTKVSNLRLWSDSRTASEIADNRYKVITGTADNLVASWYGNTNDHNDDSQSYNLTATGTPTFSEDTPVKATDLRITTDSAGTTEIPFEVVSMNASASTCEIWAKVPTLSYNSATSLFIWYGNSSALPYSATDTFGSQNVWSDYIFVKHQQSSNIDSTGNGHNGTDTAVTYQDDSLIGNSGEFNGTTSVTALTDSASLEPSNLTIQAFVRPDAIASTSGIFTHYFESGATRYGIRFYIESNVAKMGVHDGSSSTYKYVVGTTTLSADTRYLIHGTYNASNAIVYLNGASDKNEAYSNAISWTSCSNPRIGSENYTGSNSAFFNGGIDELRYKSTALAPDWIATEYNNQNSPSTFWTPISGRRIFVIS